MRKNDTSMDRKKKILMDLFLLDTGLLMLLFLFLLWDQTFAG